MRVLTPNISVAQMKVNRLGFNRTEAVFSIGAFPAQEKTEQLCFSNNELHSLKPTRVLPAKIHSA